MLSNVFNDMLKIPTPMDTSAQQGPIFIDESAQAIALVMSILLQCRKDKWYEEGTWEHHTREAALRICDKLDIEYARPEVTEMIENSLRSEPFEVFVLASQESNLSLGKRAIEFMDFNDGNQNLWHAISGAKSKWQIALVKLVIPDPMYFAKMQ